MKKYIILSFLFLSISCTNNNYEIYTLSGMKGGNEIEQNNIINTGYYTKITTSNGLKKKGVSYFGNEKSGILYFNDLGLLKKMKINTDHLDLKKEETIFEYSYEEDRLINIDMYFNDVIQINYDFNYNIKGKLENSIFSIYSGEKVKKLFISYYFTPNKLTRVYKNDYFDNMTEIISFKDRDIESSFDFIDPLPIIDLKYYYERNMLIVKKDISVNGTQIKQDDQIKTDFLMCKDVP